MSEKLLVIGSVAYDCIETPDDSADFILGGSASYAALAASYFAPTIISAVVGNDFKESDIKRLTARSVDISNLQFDSAKPTFFWRGKYHENFNSRETLDVRLNAYEDFKPALDENARNAGFVLLGNISPAVQSAVLDLVREPRFVVLDTMDLWIGTERDDLMKLVRRCDLLIVNDSEAKMLADTSNIIVAGNSLLKLGAESAIVKTGEYGAMLFHKDGFFTIPAYPVASLHDPTGAGDSFAGALAGYLAGCGKTDFASIKLGMLAGAATASMTVESFSCYKLEENGLDEIERRCEYIKKISQIQ